MGCRVALETGGLDKFCQLLLIPEPGRSQQCGCLENTNVNDIVMRLPEIIDESGASEDIRKGEVVGSGTEGA